jgi:DNA-binding Lrp family transcriptional regulator
MALDLTDLGVLRILQRDARTPVLEIAKELGISRPTVKARIEKLQGEGIIKKFTAIVDRDAIVKNILLFLRMRMEDKGLVDSLKEMDEVLEIYETMGERNLTCKAIVRDMGELRDFMDRLSQLGIKEVDSSIVLKTVKEEYEAIIGPEIGVSLNCEYCGKEITGAPYKFKVHNKEHYLCCPVCLKSFKRKMKYAQ